MTATTQVDDVSQESPPLVPRRWLKFVFDESLALALILLLSPVFIVVLTAIFIEGVLVRSSRGPFFYCEKRISQGIPFNFYKFRIFKVAAIQEMRDKIGCIKTKDLEIVESNLTAVGKVLKKFYMDELPQLFNILMGDMSFVGTRPWNIGDYEKEIAKGEYRKKIIKSGLVGPVQVGKGTWDFYHRQAELDHEYIDKCRRYSQIRLLWYDIRIIFSSIFVVFRGKGL